MHIFLDRRGADLQNCLFFPVSRGDREESPGFPGAAECFPQSQRLCPLHQSAVGHQDHVGLEPSEFLPAGVDPAAHLTVCGARAPEATPSAGALFPAAGDSGIQASLRAPRDPG